MKTKRDFVRTRLAPAVGMPARSQSWIVGMDGSITAAKSVGRSPLFNWFHGIEDPRLTNSPHGLARAYASSVLAWRCINVIADTFAALPLKITDAQDNPLPDNHPFKVALTLRGGRLKRTTAKDYNIWGVGYWLPYPQQARFQRLNPQTVEPIADVYGGLQYFRHVAMGTHIADIAPRDIVYFWDYDPDNDFGSISPTALALRAIGIEISLETFVKTFFENNATPAGVLTTDQHLQDPDAERYSAQWDKKFAGAENAGKTAVLGAGLTFAPITPLLKDLVVKEINEYESRAICQAYGVPMTIALATDAANFATMKEQHQMFYGETILPFAAKIFDEINLQAAGFFGGDVKVTVDTAQIDVLQEDKTEVTQRAQMAYTGGIITLNEARRRDGEPEIEGGDFILLGGQPVTLTDLQAGKLPIPQAAPAFPFMSSSAQLESGLPDAGKTVGDALCLMYKIGAQVDLVSLQNQLKTRYPGIQWTDPQDFYITLVYAPNVTDDQMQQLIALLHSIDIPAPSLQIGSLHAFDNLGEHALHFRIRRNGDLLNFQHELYEMFGQAGIECSSYSDPSQYIPHITMGYAPERMPAITFNSKLKVTPQSLILDAERGEGQYETVFEQAVGDAPMVIEQPAKSTRLANDDLTNWRKKALARGKDTPFARNFLPSAIADFTRMDLAACDGSYEAVNAIFETARKALKADDPDLATPEEFERYWRGIGGLYDSIARTFQAGFNELPKRLASRIRRDGASADLSKLLDEYAQEQMQALVGTEDNPGALVKVFLAGAARGNDLVGKAVSVAWDIVNQAAMEWAQKYSADLVKGITDTTKEVYRQNIAAWMESGQPLSELARAIEGDLKDLAIPDGWSAQKIAWATSPERAALIAQTESTEAFHRGVTTRWKQVGVEKFRWRTQNDGTVCDLCDGLNNKTGSIDKGIEYKGNYYKPAAHGGCRCFGAPA